MRIYCQYSTEKTLLPKGGDYITEIGMATAMSQFAEVYYSGTRFDPTKDDYGLIKYPESVVSRMLERDYDVYYVRANKEVFQAVPEGKVKLWVASPFDIECYKDATAIVTYTKAWEKALRRGCRFSWFPPEYRKCKFSNVVTIHQVVGDHFKPQCGSQVEKIRKEIGGNFIIGYFGRLSKTNFPYALVEILPQLVKKYPGLRFLFGLTKVEQPLLGDLPNVIQTKFPYSEMSYVLSACDAVVVLSAAAAWSIGGCIKVIEAAACGVPVLLPYGEARAELLGDGYVYFLGSPPCSKSAVRVMVEMVIENEEVRQQVARELPVKAKFYSVVESAKRIKRTFEGLMR